MRYGRFMLPIGRSIAVVLAALAFVSSAAAHQALIDPALKAARGPVSVIVTAHRDSRAAATAVRRAGGSITADLWIVNAVTTTASPAAIARLAKDPAITSIVENKKVRTADYNGWITDLRENRSTVKLSMKASSGDFFDAPASNLADGGFVAVSAFGEVIIVNADGSERTRVWLPNNDRYISSPLAGPTNLIYIISAYKTVTALNAADGAQQWRDTTMVNTNANYVANAVLGPATGNLYVVDTTGVIYAYNGATGTKVWTQSVLSNGRLTLGITPAIDSSETLYVVTGTSSGGAAYAVNAYGVVWNVPLAAAPGVSAPLAGSTLYAVAGQSMAAIDSSTGVVRIKFNASSAINGGAAVASDGSVLVSTASMLYCLSPDGHPQWSVAAPASGNGENSFATSPLVTADGTIYILGTGTQKKNSGLSTLFAFNKADGTQLWSYAAGAITVPMNLDPDGSVLIADASNILRFNRTCGGAAVDKIDLDGAVRGVSQSSAAGNIVATVGNTSVSFVGRPTDQWNGRKDVEIISTTKGLYRLEYPLPIDIGADKLHRTVLSHGTYIRGGDVVAAVVDSGVYWSPAVRQILGPLLQHQFIGQADFIESTCPPSGPKLGCTQYKGYAFYDHNNSRDGFGHGTHVAGTISDKLQDQGTITQSNPYSAIGIAPDARIVSVRVLGNDGTGSYATVIQGIQYLVANQSTLGVRLMNLSISAYSTVPYFVDPLDRAVEKAWQSGITVLAAAGNTGPFAGSITVPGNDPYVITVGAVNGRRTAGYWKDDIWAPWSAAGPTFDGFAKPDVLAPGAQVVSFMFNDPAGANTQYLVSIHPDYAHDQNLFRMNGTSMATAVTSGVVALMLQVNPQLTPNQVKYRLANTAKLAWDANGSNASPLYNTLQQGMGRVWAPDAVLSPVDAAGVANYGMDINGDLGHQYDTLDDLNDHYQGPIRRTSSTDSTAYLYYAVDPNGTAWGIGATWLDGNWMSRADALSKSWNALAAMRWTGGDEWNTDPATFASERMIWSGGDNNAWGSERMIWSGARMLWSSERMIWSGSINLWMGGAAWSSERMIWSGSNDAWGSERMIWSGSISGASGFASNFKWVGDVWLPPGKSGLPAPAGTNY